MRIPIALVLNRCSFFSLVVAPFAFIFAQAPLIDEAYNEKIEAYTTDSRFLPSTVLDLPDHPTVPSPLEYFGEIIGAPGVMHRSSEIYRYFQKLSETSPHLTVRKIATSEEGRDINLVIIADAATMQRLDHYQNQLALLADPRKVNAEEAARIIEDSKPVYYLNGGLHSPEMGSPEMLMELAYRLATGEEETIKTIRENVITLINPVSEPDGRDKQVDWYYRYSKAREHWDDDFPRSPPYWGKYVYHDNNRDGIQVSQQLTKAIFNIFFDWHPTVMLDLHESVPLLYISTGTGPYNEQVDPITISEWQVMGNHDVTALTAQGLPGAFTWAFYDGWWPGYAIWVANNHNSVGRFYETYGNAGANTYLRNIDSRKYAGEPATSREWYRPDPATKWVNWSSRNNINYMQAGVLASLNYAADNARTLLHNFYRKGVNSLNKGRKETPRAFVIPADQRDPAMAAYLVNQLRAQHIEVHETVSGPQKGDYVVLLQQPYRNLAVTLLSKQNYPKEAKHPPYDDIAWTLGYLYGVKVQAVDSITHDLHSLRRLDKNIDYEGRVSGQGSNYFIKYRAQNTVLPALFWLKRQNTKAKVSVLDEMAVLHSDSLQAGALVLENLTEEQAVELTRQFDLTLHRGTDLPDAKRHELTLPRIALYHSWIRTQNEGWARFTFEQRKIPYTSIDKDDLKQGDLKQRFDVILIPRMRGSAADFIHGVDSKFGPMPFTQTEEYPSHGFPDSTNDMTGGPGFDGLHHLQQFVRQGGVLITLDNASAMIAGTGMTRELTPYQASGLFHPGSVVQVKVRKSDSPVFYGYPEQFHIFRGNGPLLQVSKYNREMMLLQYGTQPLEDEIEYRGPILGLPAQPVSSEKTPENAKSDPYVLSGMVKGEKSIIGHGGLFKVPVGRGHVMAFTFNPLHRFLNHHDAPLVWNILINWDHLGE